MKALDRAELQRRFPEGVPVQCGKSSSSHLVSPNEIFAVESKMFFLVGPVGVILSFLSGGVFVYSNWSNVLGDDLAFLFLVPIIILIPWLIAYTFIKNERARISLFNRHYI
ncbi:hypothetical protein [Lewinella sp. W8]|uniref:hypothetical protein n=1 Tax=Lewinella sp. W8 TaxID=2528208 RepID=UPI0011A16015|nr:hypothetical protein [Lewinella sp. W8]MTB50780.1 hypothetical protein [Lewinella sp. W8]